MVAIASVNIDSGLVSAVNISQPVGFVKGRGNLREDVLLIQVLFNYISRGLSPGAVGLGGEYKIPAMTGIMDADTSSAIGAFQLANASKLLMNTYDNRIDPAHYHHRRINSHARQFMSITWLHFLATDAAVMQSHYDYIQGLAKLNLQLALAIDQVVINF